MRGPRKRAKLRPVSHVRSTLVLVCWLVASSACLQPVSDYDAGVDAGLRAADGGAPDASVNPLDAGERCTTGTALCDTAAEARECRDGGWRSVPCRGPDGCVVSAGAVQCDVRGSLAGDPCPTTQEGRGLCTVDGRGTLECRGGVFSRTIDCRTCTMSGDLVICQP